MSKKKKLTKAKRVIIMAERSDSEEVKLLGMWASPFSRRIEIALTLKGVSYEFSEEDITNKSSLLLQLNPVYKMIPVLVHTGKPISESLVILEYIDETWRDNPILPQDPYEKAMARFWAKFVDEQIYVTAMKVVGKIGEERDAVVEATRDLLMFLEKELVGKDFFGGRSLGFVDIVATLVAFWLMRTEEIVGVKVVPVEKFPEIHRWVKNLLGNDVIKKCIPPEDEHLQYIRARMEKLNIKSA
ncbi:glutathione S-transferase U7 [Arabidopsis lyrata subsp. lyrata]|uniref:glutathione S-transferase U7 n=1 Tax=Arabidopsis lyrata subsp. lyrata TaxID=81972 RepID=UPI000A29B1BF|nr:glutathione S-transferase U7 [Arabidopsis lyrata subsp. lyrata]|eukprot:XP_020885256.1 glutathione S-transferase U7 [Arabidopsis lyrata subsp. lyrata]